MNIRKKLITANNRVRSIDNMNFRSLVGDARPGIHNGKAEILAKTVVWNPSLLTRAMRTIGKNWSAFRLAPPTRATVDVRLL